MKLILASQSPRRLDLLQKAGVNPKVLVTDTDETITEKLTPEQTVAEISKRKIMSAMKCCSPEDYLISADTIVACNNEILGKPKDENDARRMLHLLSDSYHYVLTGVCVAHNSRIHSDICKTSVRFKKLSEKEIENYILSGEPYGKAGGYAIQEHGDKFVISIEGPWDNVVGLPVDLTESLLKRFGISFKDFEN